MKGATTLDEDLGGMAHYYKGTTVTEKIQESKRDSTPRVPSQNSRTGSVKLDVDVGPVSTSFCHLFFRSLRPALELTNESVCNTVLDNTM